MRCLLSVSREEASAGAVRAELEQLEDLCPGRTRNSSPETSARCQRLTFSSSMYVAQEQLK